MKSKNLFITLGLAVTLGVAGLAGVSMMKGAEKVSAGNNTEETHVFYVAVADSVLASYTDPEVRVNCNIGDGGTWKQTVATNLGDTTTYSGYTVFYATYTEKYGGTDAMQVQIYTDDWKEQVVINNSWDTTDHTGKTLLYKAGTGAEGRTFEWKDDSYTPPLTEYTVTKLAVEFIDGVAQEPADWELGSDKVLEGGIYSVPGSVTKDLEHFEGWYKDKLCTVAYEAAAVTADMTLYAKFTRMAVDSYFYWTDKDSGDFTHFYFFGEYSNGAWPGTALTAISEVLYLNGEGKIYKIPCPSIGDFKVILNSGNDDVKSFDMVVTQHQLAYTWYDHQYEATYYYDYSFNENSGLAADFLIEAEALRNDVEASGNILQYSVCGISQANATALYAKYEALSADVRGLVDASYTYTYKGAYDGETVPDQDNIFYSAIMEQIGIIAGRNNTNANYISQPSEVTTPVLIAIVASIALLSTASIITVVVIKRRRFSK